MKPLAICMVLLIMSLISPNSSGCTVFSAARNNMVLAGNNEDWQDTNSSVQFVPASAGKFGAFFLLDYTNFPQGGFNERGLFYDICATPQMTNTTSKNKPSTTGAAILAKCMQECSTVSQMLQVFASYNLTFMESWQVVCADSTGDAAIIEVNTVIRKTGVDWQVSTNFLQSQTSTPFPDTRYNIAANMLKTGNISIAGFGAICDAAKQEGSWPTVYSTVYDLKNKTITLYIKRDYTRKMSVNLLTELQKGTQKVKVYTYFNPTLSSIANQPIAGFSSLSLRNCPNPFASGTSIQFNLPKEMNVTLTVYNSLGRKVAQLANGNLDAGNHRFPFHGESMASEYYFCKITGNGLSEVRKMVIKK